MSKLLFASTKFYLSLTEDGDLEPSVDGTLFKDNKVNYEDVENFEYQLAQHIKLFKFKPLNQPSKEDAYCLEVEIESMHKGRALTYQEINTIYSKHYP